MLPFLHRYALRALSFSGALYSCLCLFVAASAQAQQSAVIGQVEVVRRTAAKQESVSGPTADASNVVVWLMPSSDPGSFAPAAPPVRYPQLVQRNKSFEPHVLVVQVGTTVQFPNKDPFFHNVFSLFDGKRFDLGLYEGGSTNSARFEREGISFLFCNIHPEMSAVVVAVPTPHFAVSDRSGRFTIPNVPEGRYLIRVWYERSSTDDLKKLEHSINITDSSRLLPAFQVIDNGDYKLAHKNKYGQDYVPAASPSYSHP